MSGLVESRLSRVGLVHHDALLRVLEGLEEAGGGGSLPGAAEALRRAVWPFLAAYGRRDARGGVDDRVRGPVPLAGEGLGPVFVAPVGGDG